MAERTSTIAILQLQRILIDWFRIRCLQANVSELRRSAGGVDRMESLLVGVVVKLIPGDDEAAIQAAINLGNMAKSTLGLMPFTAYRRAAAAGSLLLAYVDGHPSGYALFEVNRDRVRLNHLCVDPQRRGDGLARRLVEWISGEYASYPGILAKCREDYGMGPMWIRLGFTQIGERPGRSQAGHRLISWWRDHHHPDLFTRDEDGVLVKAAIDLNVLRDLIDSDRTDADESRALISDQIADRLDLVRTAALDAEIDKMDGARRTRCIAQLRGYPSMRPPADRVTEIKSVLLTAAQAADAAYPRTDQDRFDLLHVAESIAADLNVLVTRDRNLTRIFGQTAQRYGLRILRPVDVIVHLDELVRAEAYRPAALLGTQYRQQLIGTDQNDDDLAGLVNHKAAERPRQLIQTMRDLALDRYDRLGLYDPDGDLVALIATRHEQGVLEVPLLRVANVGLADTIARQVIFHLRTQARESGSTIVQITDANRSGSAGLAAIDDGFREHERGLFAFVVDQSGPAADVERHAIAAARRAGVPLPAPLRSDMPAVVAAQVELTWWPAKITDSAMPSYLVPIQQRYSADLLGVPANMLPRENSFGLAREHVYYRSPGGLRLDAPARVLWYMSTTGYGVMNPAAVIACSQLDAVVNGSPDDLLERFQHLGVLEMKQLQGIARNGVVQALRFTRTELLNHIPRARLRKLAAEHGVGSSSPQQPLRIPSALFAAIYQEGRRR